MTPLPRPARLVFLAFALVTGAADAAVAACPPADASDRPFVLRSATGSATFRVRRVSPDEVAVTTLRGGREFGTTFYRDGLFPTSVTQNGERSYYEHEPDRAGFRPEVGRTVRVRSVLRRPGRPDAWWRSEIAVVGESRVAIGPCGYRVLVVERASRFDDGSLSVSLLLFSPELGVTLRARETRSDGQVRDTRFSSVDADGL